MKVNWVWFGISILACCLLVGCGSLMTSDTELAYMDGRGVGYEEGYESGYDSGYEEGYDEGYYGGYENGYDEGHMDAVDEILYRDDGYFPTLISEDVKDRLLYLVLENNGNRYRAEEYANIVWDFFEENYYYMTEEQVEAFANVLTYCDDAEWVARNIVNDMQFPPS